MGQQINGKLPFCTCFGADPVGLAQSKDQNAVIFS